MDLILIKFIWERMTLHNSVPLTMSERLLLKTNFPK